jgi:hypothetical protein
MAFRTDSETTFSIKDNERCLVDDVYFRYPNSFILFVVTSQGIEVAPATIHQASFLQHQVNTFRALHRSSSIAEHSSVKRGPFP